MDSACCLRERDEDVAIGQLLSSSGGVRRRGPVCKKKLQSNSTNWAHAAVLLAAVVAALLPAAVQPCGHHVVHSDIQALVALHKAHQAAHPSSGAWGRAVDVHADSYDGLADGAQYDSYDSALHSEERDDPDRRSSSEEEFNHHSHDEHLNIQERRRLQQSSPPPASSSSSPPPGPIRLSVAYQQLEQLDAAQQQMLTRVVEAVRRILQKFITIKNPPSGGLLADPYCTSYSYTFGCTSYFPDFVTQNSTNVKCGLATFLPEHVINPANCSRRTNAVEMEALVRGGAASGGAAGGAGGAASGAGGGASAYGSGCSSYAGTQGDSADMYFYITAVQNDDCRGGAAAWARPCLMDLGNNRPLVGAANICPAALKGFDEGKLSAVLVHEMIHALGFTESMFNMTRRADGSHRPLSEVVQSAQVGDATVSRLVTPAVREAARAHFGCPDLAGAQLEDEGNAGSAGSHWEYNHYQGEVMVASTIFAADGSPPALSNMTLAYLEDTGWYGVNRSAAGLLGWGAGAGCALPSSSCRQYMQAVPGQRLFCDPATAGNSQACSGDYKATGVCRTLNFTGGCGLLLSRNVSQTCTGPNAAYDMPDVFGWGSGSPSGRCLPVVYRFQATMGGNRYTFPSNGLDGDADAACFDTVCSADGAKVYVKLLGKQFECPAGAYLSLAQLLPGRYSSGRIGPCPTPQAICSTQSCSACSATGGDCLYGTCYCRLPYTGPSCTQNLITGQALQDAGSAGNSSNSTSGSDGVTPSPPPPPPAAVWSQVVQLTMALTNTPTEVQARAPALAASMAAWAKLDLAAVSVALVSALNSSSSNGTYTAGDSNTGSSGSAAANSSSDSAVQQAGQAYSGTVGSRRQAVEHSRRLQQGQASPPLAPAAPAASPASEVTLLLSTNSGAATSQLVGRLQDAAQLEQLYGTLAAANFSVQRGSVTYQTLITKVTAQPPPPSSSPSAGVAPLTADATAASSDKSRLAIIIAIAAGGTAAAGIIVAVVVVFVVRARRSRAKQHHSLPKRADRYQLTAGGNRGSSGSGGGGPPLAAYGPAAAAAAASLPVSGGVAGQGGAPVTVHAYAAAAPPGPHAGGGWPAGGAAGGGGGEFTDYSPRVAAPVGQQHAGGGYGRYPGGQQYNVYGQ